MFEKKVVAITGAGSGIGQALAVQFAGLGARLALSDINQRGLDETLSLLPKHADVRTYIVDVSLRQSVFDYADSVGRDFGFTHYVINNAGTSVIASFQNVTLEEMHKVIDINLWGVIHGSKAFLPRMLERREGCIVNVSSVFGLVATPGSVAYTISKFGVRGLTETLWQELEGTGVRAVLVHPGGINTNISKNSLHARAEGNFERRVAEANLRQMTTPPADCAREIIAGLTAGKKRLLVGNGAKTLHLMSRLMPDGYGAVMKKKLGV
ncbi:SDR family oxidoreductase [Bradyrhizobium manausense]|uniref:SDR family NAD(P)-dependent oxidoreductase n=1 Tax=Bradyrhizobium manausense TaxID=989370 RepID=UPI001BAB594F|nr:SDR family oxidoreductase [Bradyrhizobium manausense]MBR0834235.1 SDR family oxidoreductase [Bradyrhizobium manausense]